MCVQKIIFRNASYLNHHPTITFPLFMSMMFTLDMGAELLTRMGESADSSPEVPVVRRSIISLDRKERARSLLARAAKSRARSSLDKKRRSLRRVENRKYKRYSVMYKVRRKLKN
jgi:hypothetical protein